MTTPVWQPGTLYPPGALVQPVSAPTPVNTAITNPGFESGDVNWDKGTGWTIGAVSPYQGTNAAQFNFTGTSDITSAVFVAVSPGQSISCAVMVQQGASSSGQAGARVFLKWYTSADVFISESLGSQVNDGSGGAWGQSILTATAPANAAKVKIGARAFRSSGTNPLWIDVFTWNYTALSVPTGLVYRAVQAVTGASASVEPVWPLTLGLTVVDGDVTWEAVQATRVTWEANPIFLSGGSEPTWPTRPGEFVIDGSFQWQAISRYVADTRSPNTIPVAILATHVFAGDDDIIKFSASTNALDWTTPRDAGYLPSGLQQANSNEMAVLAPYRGNLAAFNASSFQLWQADPDPEAMYLLDQQDGIGSIWPRAAVAISSDLYYLAALGVRTVSQAAGNNSLNSGDVGMPVDTLAQEYLAACVASGAEPIATYYPSLGQYLLAFRLIGPEITGNAPAGSIGIAYSYSYTVTGNATPLAVTVASGTLPPGLTLSTAGVLSGTPTTGATYNFTVRVTDANGLYDDLAQTVSIVDGAWFAGPVAQNGSLGGSEAFYLRAATPELLASSTPIANPANGSGTIQLISTANGAVFLHRSGAGSVSFDKGATWSACNIPLSSEHPVYWNGSFYWNHSQRSADGITWSAITGLPSGATGVWFGRANDGLILAVANSGLSSATIHRSTDNGATWNAGYAQGVPLLGQTYVTNGTRIWGGSQNSLTGIYSDDGFATGATFGSTTVYKAFYGNGVVVSLGINTVDRTLAAATTSTTVLNTSVTLLQTVDYGNGVWSVIDTIGGTPNSHLIYTSTDDAATFTSTGLSLYGANTSIVWVQL